MTKIKVVTDNGFVTRYLPTAEAARRLGVEPATLYAYVSRGLLSRRRAVDGRTSLFAVDDLDALAQRGRRRPAPPAPSVEVQIATGVTELEEGDLRYRGWSVPELAREGGFEAVAELLWTGTRPVTPVRWPAPDAESVAAARAAGVALGPAADGVLRLVAMVAAVAGMDPLRGDRSPAAVAATGRRLIGALARALGPAHRRPAPAGAGGGAGATVAHELVSAWSRQPSTALVAAVDRALVLLADHELASSTLAVRVAASTWADPYAAVLAGLGVVSGPLHGAAGGAVLDMLCRCEAAGPAAVLGEYLREGVHVPGYGHKVYRGDDPRVAPLLESVRALGSGSRRLAVLDEWLRLTDVRVVKRPNVDLALGALAFVSGTAIDAGVLFALARIAGWLAHAIEEYGEPPLRFRANARYVGTAHPPSRPSAR